MKPILIRDGRNRHFAFVTVDETVTESAFDAFIASIPAHMDGTNPIRSLPIPSGFKIHIMEQGEVRVVVVM